MSSGLYLVLLVNIAVACLGILFYRYVILRGAGLLSPEEARLLRKYPAIPSKSYTPTESFVTAPPPMRWTTWRDFFTASENPLSRDAQVYLLFQRACIVTTAICATVATVILLPCYWLGGAVFKTGADRAPSLLSLLKSDRGVFERFTSHNLPSDSPLFMLQLPVIMVTALCIIVMYSVVKAAAGEQRSVQEWLASTGTTSSFVSSPRPKGSPKSLHWTLFARGLPQDIQEADDLAQFLEALYPGQVVKVELVCKGKMSEARLLRALSSARSRLEYLCQSVDESPPQRKQGPFSRFFCMMVGKRSTSEMIDNLRERIEAMQKDFESRKSDRVTDFTGCAFITFRSATAASSVLEDFPVHIYSRAERSSLRRNDIDMTIGRHSRCTSEWSIPRLQSLYRGALNLLPYQTRERIFRSSDFAPDATRAAVEAQETLVENAPEGVTVTPEIATAKLRNMKAERAPKSGDIIWRNIGISFFERTVREMVVQVIVFAILILFTSPVAMLTALRLIFAELALLSDPQMIFSTLSHHNATSAVTPLGGQLNETNGFDFLNNIASDGGHAVESISQDLMALLPPFLSKNTFLRSALLAYLPVLMLAVVFAIVPSLLRLTCSLEGYPTYSAQEMSVFRKTSFYYVMNAVVLPSVALNTASEFLAVIYNQSDGGANVYNALPVLQRLFSGDIAFFLCNYLIQLALTGSVFWLLALPTSFSMMIRRRRAVTPLEEAEAKCADIFDYPRHYAYSVTVMSMCLLFGFMAPLIWHFALFYFVCKHTVDVYTIRYVHPPTHIDGRLPRLSANFILTWTTVSQLSLAVIFYLQGWVKAAIATTLFCLLTLTACVSVSTQVGNRLLRYIAGLRDRAIEKIMDVAASNYEWMPSTLAESSSTSSSTQSLPDSRESDALLMKNAMVRRISAEIGSMKDLRTSSVRPGSVASTPEPKSALKSSHSEGIHVFGDLSENVGEGSVECTDELDSPANVFEDLEGGCTRAISRYGTCDPVNKENIPRRQQQDEFQASSSSSEP